MPQQNNQNGIKAKKEGKRNVSRLTMCSQIKEQQRKKRKKKLKSYSNSKPLRKNIKKTKQKVRALHVHLLPIS
uniref:Uncharacterized protein n=1 Tax=Cucumis melo TaxID=3656 RepID=A0A9I9E6B8_CUCME